MARKAIQSVNTNEQKSAANGKQEIKSLPGVFTNEENFRAYIALAALLSTDKAADKANAGLTKNHLLTVKQSIANYKANGIELEQEYYPVAVNIGGLFCGINRRQRVIFAVCFIGERKLAFTVSTRAQKELPELLNNEKVAEKYGYAPKYLNRLDANNGTLLPASVDFNHFVDNNFGLPFCYSTSKADLLDFGQWLNNKSAFDTYKTQAAAFEEINYYGENCIADFCEVAKKSGFEVYRQDVMKVAIDHMVYLQGVIKDSDKHTAAQQAKARDRLYGAKKVDVDKTANELSV